MSSKDYYVKHLAVDLPLATADKIADVTLATGRAAGMLPLTVVVLDAGGHVVVQKREDGSGILRAEIARGKAYAALGMGIGSRIVRDRLKERIAFQAAVAAKQPPSGDGADAKPDTGGNGRHRIGQAARAGGSGIQHAEHDAN
ncbi:MAG: heme-binding protein [Acetobacteraceae bacterium]|nr:heme-binding protein [Acetobacteraceae bacterium]